MLLEAKNLSWAPANGAGGLHNVSFTLDRGGLVLVRGPSGGGKTSLLRLLVRLNAPTGGDVLFEGRSIAEYDPARLRRKIGLLPQTPVVVDGSVRDNLLLPFGFAANRDAAPPSDADLDKRLGETLLSGISLNDPAANLSVGQKQRLCLLRTLLLCPDILLLDEPVSALDATSKQVVEDMIETRNLEEGVAVMLVTHADFRPKRTRPSVLVVENGAVREETWTHPTPSTSGDCCSD